jgi:hypothetical protein
MKAIGWIERVYRKVLWQYWQIRYWKQKREARKYIMTGLKRGGLGFKAGDRIVARYTQTHGTILAAGVHFAGFPTWARGVTVRFDGWDYDALCIPAELEYER